MKNYAFSGLRTLSFRRTVVSLTAGLCLGAARAGDGNPARQGLAEGMNNADIDGEKGITGNDALAVQKIDAGLI